MPRLTEQRTLAVVDLSNANQKLTDLYDIFAAAPGRVAELAHCIQTLHRTFERLRVSLEQTNRPFEGYDGFERTLKDCDLFVQCFTPPRPGRPWLCEDEDISNLWMKIMMQNSLLDTSALVLLAETFFSNERDPGPSNGVIQSNLPDQHPSIKDPEFEKLWEKVKRVVYRRKRKPVPEPKNNTGRVLELESLEKDVQNRVRQLMLNHPPPIPEIASIRRHQDWDSPQFQRHLDLEALPDEKLLERTQQQERFLLSASGQRSHPRPPQSPQRSASISPKPPSRVWTLRDDDEHLMGTEFPGKQILLNGTIRFSLKKAYVFDLCRVEAVTIDRKRKIKCTAVDNRTIITHELPPKSRRHMITYHPKVGRAESSSISFSESLPVEIRGKMTVTGADLITYNFAQTRDFQLFQEIVKEKNLLYTFCVETIMSAEAEETSYQHLKLWRERKSGLFTLSFYKNVATEKKHLEFSLGAFSSTPTKDTGNNDRTVRLDFASDSASSKRTPPEGQYRVPSSKKRNSVDSLASFQSEAPTRYMEKMRELGGSLKFLSIEFTYAKDVSTFINTFKKIHEIMERESWILTFEDSDEGSSLRWPSSISGAASESFFFVTDSPQASPLSLGPFTAIPRLIPDGVTRSNGDYTVGWITALPIEMSAAIAMLDERHQGLSRLEGDPNAYILGRIGNHNVVITCLPIGLLGTSNAAAVATRMEFSFPKIEIGLMVGIGGGVPSKKHDIRLGDVVISKPGTEDGGVVQYDFGKKIRGGLFQHTGRLPPPPQRLLSAISVLEALRPSTFLEEFDVENLEPKFGHPGTDRDVLFEADYDHVEGEEDTCAACDPSRIVEREPRRASPMVHYGTIASGNQLMRDGKSRDELARQFGVLCFEMEAAGLMTSFPCLVIRGICDYADTHKNKEWQGYAAAAAASYAKELLQAL